MVRVGRKNAGKLGMVTPTGAEICKKWHVRQSGKIYKWIRGGNASEMGNGKNGGSASAARALER